MPEDKGNAEKQAVAIKLSKVDAEKIYSKLNELETAQYMLETGESVALIDILANIVTNPEFPNHYLRVKELFRFWSSENAVGVSSETKRTIFEVESRIEFLRKEGYSYEDASGEVDRGIQRYLILNSKVTPKAIADRFAESSRIRTNIAWQNPEFIEKVKKGTLARFVIQPSVENIAHVTALINAGKKIKDIAQELDVDRSVVHRFIENNSIVYEFMKESSAGSRGRWKIQRTPDIANNIINLVREGLTQIEIAALYDVESETAIRSILRDVFAKKINIGTEVDQTFIDEMKAIIDANHRRTVIDKTRGVSRKFDIRVQENFGTFMKLYNQPLFLTEIAAQLGVNPKIVYRIIKSKGWASRDIDKEPQYRSDFLDLMSEYHLVKDRKLFREGIMRHWRISESSFYEKYAIWLGQNNES